MNFVSKTWNRWTAGALGCLLLVAVLSVWSGAAWGEETITAADELTVEAAARKDAAATRTLGQIPAVWWLAPLGAILALVFARIFYTRMLGADEGDEDMKRVSGYVREGAMAYLRQQYKVVIVFFILVSGLLFWMGWYLRVQHQIAFVAFLTGGFFSGLCGWLGMMTATRASHRTAAGARKSLNDGLQVAFRSGAVMGLIVVGFGLLDISIWFLLLYSNVLPWDFVRNLTLNDLTVVMLTLGMGASAQALFARVGGGIYTKAADVGADLVGKVESNIPEDDPRNPATIADNVGDNVGDVAGMGADLFESHYGSILATMALGAAAAAALFGIGAEGVGYALRLIALPMVLSGVGVMLSLVGIYIVRTGEEAGMGELLNALRRGIYGAAFMIAAATLLLCWLLLSGIEDPRVNWFGIWGAIMAGLVAGNIIGYATEYYTSYEYRPTQRISEQAITGPATVIIAGIATGMKSTWASLLTIIAAILCAFIWAGGMNEFLLGLYGVGIAAVGMLATLGITLATDAYGPIADNAGGNAEMTGQQPHVRQRTDTLDSLGNTTAAMGKGFAIGSAALTALALLAAYIEGVRIGQAREAQSVVMAADKTPDPTRALYFGHGKAAQRLDSGTDEHSFATLMVIDRTRVVGLQRDMMITDISAPDADGVQSGMVNGERVRLVSSRRASMAHFMAFYDVTLMNPRVLGGMFAGVMLVFLFCAMTMEAVGRAANRMMLECRRQFEKMRGYLRAKGETEEFVNNSENWPKTPIEHESEQIPNYANAVAISTAGAQREMIIPSLIAIAVPILVGLALDVPGVMGLLAGGLTSGFAVAIFMANSGGAWDNAKKLIETGKLGGKGSSAHKATVVGDTVGDPFKDTSGPSLNILIKLIGIVSVVFSGLVVKYAPVVSGWLGL